MRQADAVVGVNILNQPLSDAVFDDLVAVILVTDNPASFDNRFDFFKIHVYMPISVIRSDCRLTLGV